MKRKIFSKLLMGAFLIASISSFVSCKDYDDDIKKNTDAIGALQTTVNNLQQALDAAKAEANTAHAAFALKTQVASDIAAATKGLATEDAVAQVKKANEDAVAALAAEIKALATIDALEAAKKEAADALAKAMEGTATKEDLDKVSVAVSAIDSKLDGINTALAETNNNVKANADAIAAAQKNIEAQQAAIAALQEALKGTASSSAIDDVKGDVNKANQEISSVKGELAKAQADLAALRTALNSKGNQAAIDALDAKVKELEGLKTELAELKSAVTKLQDLSEVKDLMKKADEKVDKVSTNINLLTVFVTKQLRSIVFQPNFYYGGVEAVEAPAIVYRPLAFAGNGSDVTFQRVGDNATTLRYVNGNAFQAQNNTNRGYLKPMVGTPANAAGGWGISWFTRSAAAADNRVLTGATAATNVTVVTPNLFANYHMNPSSVGKENIKGVSVISDDKTYITRASASRPSFVDYDVANGMLNVEVGLNYAGIADPTLNNQKISVMATQVAYQGAQGDTIITSDYHAIAPSVYGDLVLADINAANGAALCALNAGSYFARHPFLLASQAIGTATPNVAAPVIANPAHTIPWNSNGIDLNTIFEVHGFHKIFNAAGFVDESGAPLVAQEHRITADQLKQWGFELKYELVEYTTGTERTEQTITHAQLDGSILKPWGINGSQTNASIGRQPLVRISLIDKNNANQVVLRGYSKFQIVADQAQDVNIEMGTGTRYWTCDNINHNLTWQDVEAKVLDDARIKTNGIAKSTFELLYGVDGGVANQNIATAAANINANTYIKWNGAWRRASDFSIYSGAGMVGTATMNNTIIQYVFNTAGSNRTGQINFRLTPTMIKQILAKHNARGTAYLRTNGAETNNIGLADIDFNDKVEFEIATRLYDVTSGGMPDVYIVWKYTVSKLNLTMNKIAQYWYASNNITAGSGSDEIHISVPVVGETTPIQANVALFNGDLLNTVVFNDLAIGLDGNNIVERGYIVPDLTREQRATIDGTPVAWAAGTNGTVRTTLNFYTTGSTRIGNVGALPAALAAGVNNNTTGDVVGNYLLVAQGANLWALARQNNGTYNDAGAVIVASIVNRTAVANGYPVTAGAINPYQDNTVFVLQNNNYAKALVNRASHTDLANTLTAHVNATVQLSCDAQIKVLLTNPRFDVKFLRPVDIKGVDARIFRDATDGGNTLNLVDLVQFNDWRDLWNPAFGTSTANLFNTQTVGGVTGPNYQSPKWGSVTNNYYQYYQVTRIEADINNITTDLNGGTLGTTLLRNVAPNAQFENVWGQTRNSRTGVLYGCQTNGAGAWVDARGTLPAAGPANVLIDFRNPATPATASANGEGIAQLKYSNNQTTVGTFKVRVPIRVTYYWGTQTTTVDLTVGNSLNN